MNLKRIGKLIGLGAALGLLAIFNLAAGDQGEVSLAQAECTLTLKPGQSIQEAIDKAEEGAVICLDEGTWVENIVIKKNLTLIGSVPDKTKVNGYPVTIIKGAKEGYPVIMIESDSEIEVFLGGLTITEPQGEICVVRGPALIWPLQFICPYGIWVIGKAQVTVLDSKLSWNKWGSLYVSDSAKVSLVNSMISGNWFGGLSVGGSAKVSLVNSTISGNGWNGLSVWGPAQLELKDSVIKDNRYCGILVISEDARVSGTNNTMRGNGADLCGFAPAALRKPLAPQTDRTQLSVPKDFSSIQEAVDAVAPGGTITVAAGVYHKGLTIWKPLRLVGEGIGQTTIKALPERSLIVSIIAEARDVGLEGLKVTGSQGNGLLIYSEAELQNIEVSGNVYDGLAVGGSVNVSLVNSTLSRNGHDGLYVRDSANVSLTNSQLSSNGCNGLNVSGSAKVTIKRSTIEKNGTKEDYAKAHWICNGILVGDESQTTISDSIIRDNTHWGVAAYLKKCGYKWDAFTGKVTITNTKIYGNRKGDVCLP